MLQGGTLAPFLFIVVLDYALRIAVDGREKELDLTLLPQIPAKAYFADDIALLSNNTSQAQKLLTHVEEKCHSRAHNQRTEDQIDDVQPLSVPPLQTPSGQLST